MKVADVKSIDGVLRAKAVEATGMHDATTVPQDRVSVQASKQAEDAVAVAQRAAGGRRSARAERLEADVRSGSYRPDAGRIAEQLLADAEVDAHFSALIRH